ncbi:hypothetical protein [Cellulosimicrobium sp. TH-20]|uniref:hypothetical protein n=1 Tax=Cellulosimicrobium sp. TH-20 TaxID=1980001 RepID=UPI00119D6E34|nr:hypothetical protein [Cellulosimicrobium sp. TH-20]
MRRHADAEFFRLRVTEEHSDGKTYENLLGPWSTITAARTQRTRILRDARRWRSSWPEPVVVIERCAPVWEVVE